jgi:ATP-binding cassette subfamily F protein uup
MAASEADASGALVIEAREIAKNYGERAIVGKFSTRILRGDRVGIVGPNGSGKTTLVSMLTGALAPDSGTVKIGATVEMARLTQHRDSLDPTTTVADALTGGSGDSVLIGGERRHVVGYHKDFLFAPEQAPTPLGKLSGGERGRLMLAQVLAKPSNLLVLDEPTNDLDMETLDVLEGMLGDYAGTVLLISHDRDFLDRLVTSVIVPEGDGRWTEYAGGYTDMLAQRGEDLTRTKPAKAKADRSDPERVPTPAAARKRKLSFNEKHALETLAKTLADLEAQARPLQKQLDDASLFVRDRAAFDKATQALGEVQTRLADAEERWLALEILREEIDSQ